MNSNNRVLRVVVTVAALGFAVIHHVTQFQFDTPTVILLVVAALPWLQPLFKTIELLGVKIELQDLHDKVQEANKKLELLEDNSTLPGRNPDAPRQAFNAAPRLPSIAPDVGHTADGPLEEGADVWDEDPNSGKFGGSPESNGRLLEATITPAINARSAACEVVLTVRSTDSARPLTGAVTFVLHPTFGRWKKYDVDVKRGIAQDTITSWGVFTVGAVTDDGETSLELDLRTVPGGTRKFYAQ